MYLFVFSFLEQQVASQASHAFAGCSGLNLILHDLEGGAPPTQKPMATKRAVMHKRPAVAKAAAVAKASAVAKAPAVAKVKAPAVAKAKAPAVAKAKAKAPAVAKANAPAVAQAKALSDTRKCVHSRAYKAAEKTAQLAGTSPSRCSLAARAAGKEAARQWDMTH